MPVTFGIWDSKPWHKLPHTKASLVKNGDNSFLPPHTFIATSCYTQTIIQRRCAIPLTTFTTTTIFTTKQQGIHCSLFSTLFWQDNATHIYNKHATMIFVLSATLIILLVKKLDLGKCMRPENTLKDEWRRRTNERNKKNLYIKVRHWRWLLSFSTLFYSRTAGFFLSKVAGPHETICAGWIVNNSLSVFCFHYLSQLMCLFFVLILSKVGLNRMERICGKHLRYSGNGVWERLGKGDLPRMKETEEGGRPPWESTYLRTVLWYPSSLWNPVEIPHLRDVVHSFTVNFNHIHNRSSSNNNNFFLRYANNKVITYYLWKNIKIVPKM